MHSSQTTQSSELNRIRMQKHNRLIKMIQSYKLTDKDKQNISQSKKQTQFEISIRHARSKANHNYKFTHQIEDTISDQQLEEQFKKDQVINYDLKNQNVIVEKRLSEATKFKTEESILYKGKSVSLKKIQPRAELILTRRQQVNKYQPIKTYIKKYTQSKNRHGFPTLEKILSLNRINSSKILPSSRSKILESKHKRLATQQVKKSVSKGKFKLKTQQSVNKYGSNKYIGITGSNHNPLTKTELLLLQVRPNQYKKTLLNKIAY